MLNWSRIFSFRYFPSPPGKSKVPYSLESSFLFPIDCVRALGVALLLSLPTSFPFSPYFLSVCLVSSTNFEVINLVLCWCGLFYLWHLYVDSLAELSWSLQRCRVPCQSPQFALKTLYSEPVSTLSHRGLSNSKGVWYSAPIHSYRMVSLMNSNSFT